MAGNKSNPGNRPARTTAIKDAANSPEDKPAGSGTGSSPRRERTITPVVGIGASAGGLEALQEFFRNVPTDSGIGFVVVTHMQPRRESLLPELLANVTDIPVIASEDNIRVEPNRIIVAKDSLLVIENGVLRPAKNGDEPKTLNHPIDYFFRTLANDQKEHAIAIVLSGSGNDGALGIKAIKAAGGMAMIQDPETAKYASMPESARATGLVDYTLPPGEMPAALVQYCRGPYLSLARQAQPPRLPESAIQTILVRLRAHAGHDFTCYKKSTMSRRIERRMSVHRIDEPQTYLRYLRENPHELDLLLQELLISVTSFFRDPEAFEALAQKAVPGLLAQREDGHVLRVWIPGCATGEEAYSVAILLDEQIRMTERGHDIQIFATDLDERAIEIARSGLYSEGIAADVSSRRLNHYFSREDNAFRIHKNLREKIVFAVQNVISDPPFTHMDLIVCRNLLIYLDTSAQQRVLPAFHYALQPGGLLFLGESESPGEASRLFEPIAGTHKILRRRETAARIPPAFTHINRHNRGEGQGDAAEKPFPAAGPLLNRAIERLLLERFAPCSIVVDEQGTVIYLHGRSGLYLEPEQGQPKNNILKMSREGLGSALTTALSLARQQQKEVVRRGIKVRTNGDSTFTDLSVRPLMAPEILMGLLLVTLQPSPHPEKPHKDDAGKEAPEEPGLREQLERELQYTRENLQTTIEELETSNEELKSSNEELHSTNEELQSTNEELETSKEEMQSLNEELNTVNSELQSKVEALARSNDDMNNLLNSMQVAAIFLDSELRVKRYTEQALDMVRLIGSDLGRPFSDLTHSLKYGSLIEDCHRVLATLIPREMEVRDDDNRWHLVRLMPYRTAENIIDGLVLTIIDIDRTRQALREALTGKEFFEGIVQTIREPLLVLDQDLCVMSANDAFYLAFATQPKEVEGHMIYELGNRQWNIPELRKLLEEILPKNTVMTDFRVEHEFPRIGRRAFLLNARRMHRGEEPDLIIISFNDVSENDERIC